MIGLVHEIRMPVKLVCIFTLSPGQKKVMCLILRIDCATTIGLEMGAESGPEEVAALVPA